MRSITTFALVLCLLAVPAFAAHPATGRWEGAIVLPSSKLAVVIDLEPSGDRWKGTVTFPEQGAEKLPLELLDIYQGSVSFRIAGLPGAPSFAGKVAGGKIDGTYTQDGQTFPFSVARVKAKE
jgi:hypothetical protein